MSFNRIYNDVDPNNIMGKQKLSHLEIPAKYQPLVGINNLIPMGTFFDTTVDVDYGHHAFIYIPVQHGTYPMRCGQTHL